MASDLTERLAAKLYDGTHFNAGEARMAAKFAKRILPLLLSEPELVATLPDEVRLSVLTPRERAELRFGKAMNHYDVLRRERWDDYDALERAYTEMMAANIALESEARALTPEVPRVG